MKQAVTLICIFASITIAAMLVSHRRSGGGTAHLDGQPAAPTRLIVPAGTYLTLKVVEGIFESSKPGDTMQAMSADPVYAGRQLAIPENTRVGVHIDSLQRRNRDSEDLTLRVTQLIFSGRTVPVESSPVVATMRPMSSLDLMVRSAGGMLGAAVGAAGGAVVDNDPLGAGALEGLATGTGSRETGTDHIRFQIASAIDLTGVRW
ncbi:MAG TPA: hypothetical protein VGK48_06260 [Terriglobia bacterium]|jgi:hypothetical protein